MKLNAPSICLKKTGVHYVTTSFPIFLAVHAIKSFSNSSLVFGLRLVLSSEEFPRWPSCLGSDGFYSARACPVLSTTLQGPPDSWLSAAVVSSPHPCLWPRRTRPTVSSTKVAALQNHRERKIWSKARCCVLICVSFNTLSQGEDQHISH